MKSIGIEKIGSCEYCMNDAEYLARTYINNILKIQVKYVFLCDDCRLVYNNMRNE